MLGVITAGCICFWFYSTASRSGRTPVSWAISGVVVYFIAALIWSLTVTPAIKDTAIHNQNSVLIFIVQYAYIVVGFSVAAFVNSWLNKASG